MKFIKSHLLKLQANDLLIVSFAIFLTIINLIWILIICGTIIYSIKKLHGPLGNLIPVLSARENVEFVMQLQGVEAGTRRQLAMDILEKVGLTGLEDRRPSELSGGQQSWPWRSWPLPDC